MKMLLPILVLAMSGCLETHLRDEASIAGVTQTIAAREKDFARWKKEMAKADPADRDLAGIQALQDSELDRLGRWLSYESAKEGTSK